MGVGFLDFLCPKASAEKLEIGPRTNSKQEQTRTTSLPSHSGCIWPDTLIRLVNILIELKARTKLSVLGLSLYLSLWLWHVVCIIIQLSAVALISDACKQPCFVKSFLLNNMYNMHSSHIYGLKWITLWHYDTLWQLLMVGFGCRLITTTCSVIIHTCRVPINGDDAMEYYEHNYWWH